MHGPDAGGEARARCQHRKGKGDVWASVAGNTDLEVGQHRLCKKVKRVMVHEAVRQGPMRPTKVTTESGKCPPRHTNGSREPAIAVGQLQCETWDAHGQQHMQSLAQKG